jgi:DNA polymerase III subunit beta
LKFTVNAKEIEKNLSAISGVVEKKTMHPLLDHVLFEVKGSQLTLHGTNGDMSIINTMRIDNIIDGIVDGTKDGSSAVPAHLLLDIVKKLKDEISFEFDEKILKMKCGSANFEIQVLSPDNFPETNFECENKITISSAELKFLLENTKFAMCSEESRYTLNGIFLHTIMFEDRKVLRAVATDMHRIACAHIDFDQDVPGLIISRRSISEMLRIISDGILELSFNDNSCKIESNGTIFCTRLTEGKFPDYEKSIPMHHPFRLVSERKNFYDAIERVSLISFDRNKPISIEVSESMEIKSVGSSNGSAREIVECNYEGDNLEIGINAKYLMESFCDKNDPDQVDIRIKDSDSPILILNKNSLSVLMPMRV